MKVQGRSGTRQRESDSGLGQPGRPWIAERPTPLIVASRGKIPSIGEMIRVLYAEDDPSVAGMVQLYFERHEDVYSLQVVDSGRGCLAAMQTTTFDVVLLDMRMPDLTGLEVLGELTARGDPTPVVMVSGQGEYELAVRALRAGAADCLNKNSPEFREIGPTIQRVHARHRCGEGRMAPTARPPQRRVLFVDPSPQERTAATAFFGSSAPRLQLTAGESDLLARMLAGSVEYDAVVLGPNVHTTVMLEALRKLRARDQDLPVVVLSAVEHAETAIAAFNLGAHDYLMYRDGYLTELVFSLNSSLKRADAERLNAKLTAELATLNRSLSEQVADRTRELEQEIIVRRAAESRAADHATRLQSLSNRLLRVQEDERRALAQELHDEIGQLLTGLRFQLETAQSAAPSQSLTEAMAVTGELLRSVRELTLQLRPRMLDDLGLQPALEWQTKLFQKQTGIAVELELSLPATRLNPELETTVFRMVQEALTNVARHSGGQAAVVTVTSDDAALQVEISDRGRGFDSAAALARTDSLGLAGIAERVRLSGGALNLVSVPGQGTRLHAEFPLRLRPQPSS